VFLQGDLGNSLIHTRTRDEKSSSRLFPATIELATCAAIFAIFIGLPAGIFAAVNAETIIDHSVMTFSSSRLFRCPYSWWALLLMLVFPQPLVGTPSPGGSDVTYWIRISPALC